MTLNPKQFNPGDNPDQLQLLMKPSELLAKISHFDDAPQEFLGPNPLTVDNYKKSALHRVKYKESKESGLADKIEQSGVVKQPLSLRDTSRHLENSNNLKLGKQFVLADGHHRFATALEMELGGNKDIHLPVYHLNEHEARGITDYIKNTDGEEPLEYGNTQYDS